MPVSHVQQAIFVHIPRSAGTTINVALGICTLDTVSDNTYRPDALFGFDGKRFAQHLTAREIAARLGPQVYAQYYKFTIVRNPYSRLVSAYYQGFARRGRRQTDVDGFRTFVREVLPAQFERPLEQDRHRHLKPQSIFVVDDAGDMMVDFVARYERLADDFQQVAERLGMPLAAGHLNASHGFDVDAHFDDDTRDRVRDLYRADFDLFGYEI